MASVQSVPQTPSATGAISSSTVQLFDDNEDILISEPGAQPYLLQKTMGLKYLDNVDCLLSAESKNLLVLSHGVMLLYMRGAYDICSHK